MKKIVYIISILFVAIVITTIAYALFDFNHENLIIIFGAAADVRGKLTKDTTHTKQEECVIRHTV